ncbi:interleukin-3 receptor subunit alpha isoform X2 [Equus caballus]|uniref:interleukin-3 receptor subunit alpha isoform X2 n=1 Tax=Equus caballus TaxID=9796 RepID=UPI0038B3FFC7
MQEAGRPVQLWGWGAAAPLDPVGLLVLLSWASCGHPARAQESVSPILNMKLDSRTKTLSWNYRRNVTEQECKIDTPPDDSTSKTPQVNGNDTYFCEFPNSVLHRGANLTLNVHSEGAAFQEVLVFHNSGPEGSGAVNFSCFIYDLRFLNCSWSPGPAAPPDVRYHLYWWASSHDPEVECARYIVDPAGTRVGCHLDDLGDPKTTDYFFLVNGTSNRTAVRFLDFTPFRAKLMEKYRPPANVTTAFNGSHHVVRWDDPETRFDVASHMLCYQLDIRRQGSSYKRDPVFQRGSDGNQYVLPGSAVTAGDTVRARVKHVYGDIWSAWSRAVDFNRPEPDPAGALAGLVVPAVTAAAALVGVLMFVCKRFSLRRRLFPRVPRVRMQRAGSFPPDLERTRPPAGPMAFVWITLFLTPTSGLLRPDQDPSPPIRNVRMEPESQRLTWDLHGNVSGIECSQSLEYNVTARKNQYCQFPVLPSCGSKNYTVFVTGGQPFSTSIGYPEPEGNPGAAAQNLTCWVHDVDFLTCRWAVGSAAPRDVQYHLHVGEARTSEGRECPGYTADERGTHVRCRFDDLSGFSNGLYRFRVRGTSRASGIPCSEMFEQLSRIERLSPPNITGWCNKTYSLLEWEMSSRFSWKFTYELEIQQGAGPADLVQDFETFYGMPNPGTYTVRIRARGYFTGIVSEWSAPKNFVCDPEEEGARLRVRLTASLTALGPLLALGLLVLICRKYSLMRKIFPPIPHMKDPLSDSLQNKLMIWEAGRDPREECPVAEVQVVGET